MSRCIEDLAAAERLIVQEGGWEVDASRFVIVETDFGHGLNALVAWRHWLHTQHSACLHYISCMPKALRREDLVQHPDFADLTSSLLNVWPLSMPGFHHLVIVEGRIELTLLLGDPAQLFNELLCCGDAQLEALLRPHRVDVWRVYEPISPALRQCIALLSNDAGASNLRKRNTPWAAQLPQQCPRKKAMVLGAGLAGCFTAQALSKRGWEVLLLDKGPGLASGASGNPQTILYPMLSAHHSPLTDFMLMAYEYAHHYYQRLLKTQPIGELRGILQVAYNEKEMRAQRALDDLLKACPTLGERVNPERASALAGLPISSEALYLPMSGWLDTPALCQKLGGRLDTVFNYPVDELHYENGQWILGEHRADVLVLANGYEASAFAQTQHLPLSPVGGQLTRMSGNESSGALQIPLCGDGHILPQRDHQHLVGATYHPGEIAEARNSQDDALNKSRFAAVNASAQMLDSWQGTRAATPDYFPLVGPAPNIEAFQQRFATLASDRKRWIAAPGEYYPGLYICAGFGSRGLTSIPLCADWLAGQINQEMGYLPRRFVQALSPARFLVKEMGKGEA